MSQPRIVSTVFCIRHAEKGEYPFNNVLSTKGLDDSRVFGAWYIRGHDITRIFTSKLIRTCQTAMAIIEGAGDCTLADGPDSLDLIGGVNMKEWVRRCPKGWEGLKEIETADPSFISQVGATLHGIGMKIITDTPSGTSLVVGHSPCLELMVRRLTMTATSDGISPAPFKELEGVILGIWSDGSVTIEQEIRHTA